ELYDMYKIIKKDDDTPKNRLIGSGNAIRKTPPLRRILEKKFNMPLYMPKNSEEAAFGAALYACVAIGIYNNLEDAQQIIQFEEIV
ncbi:MAG: FGGY-family carbohydrate kinase, partial [Clostridia bacterium]|nr:FGGY-family carbohydrate kinase [Clostridia bacterium]MDD3972654.1 FGGY-family carbohydrate kinase [Clostridia bacterium]